MADEMTIGSENYISSKRASEISGYAQDYIGQLARAGLIDARRVGGLWYVAIDSLTSYKEKKDDFMPTPPVALTDTEPQSLVFFDGNEYISASYASKITGYHQDYVGQLAREAKITSRQVGNRWYVGRQSIVDHKNAKDALLASVQAESVGLTGPRAPETAKESIPSPVETIYRVEDQDLMPRLVPQVQDDIEKAKDEPEEQAIPIRVYRNESYPPRQGLPAPSSHVWPHPIPRKTNYLAVLSASALTIVIVLSVGLYSFKQDSVMANGAVNAGATQRLSLTASVANVAQSVGGLLEQLLTRDIVYRRSQ